MMKALSLRFTALSVVILTFCAAVPAEAGEFFYSGRAKKLTAKATVLSDRYTLVTMINQELVGLEDALREAAEDGLRFKAVPMRNRGVELTIIFPEPIVKVNVSVKKRRKLNFQVIYQSREDLMRDRIRKRLYVPVPSSFVAGQYSDAERLLRTGNLKDALVEYNELSEEYALRAWAQLRLGDIALLGGDTRGACRRYGGVNEAFRSQISGMLAVLRRQVLACGWGRDSRPDWDVMLMRADRTGGRVGEYLRAEVVWAMGQVATADEVDLVLELLNATAIKRKAYRRQLKAQERLMVSRSVRLPKKAIDVARMCYRHTERIAKHPDAKDLNFRCSAALLELDLIEESIAKSQELIKPSKKRRGEGALWRVRDGAAQAMLLLAQAYRQKGDPDYVYATLVRYQRRFGNYVPPVVPPMPKVKRMKMRDLPIGKEVATFEKRLNDIERGLDAALK